MKIPHNLHYKDFGNLIELWKDSFEEAKNKTPEERQRERKEYINAVEKMVRGLSVKLTEDDAWWLK
jgi:hypothetical protein